MQLIAFGDRLKPIFVLFLTVFALSAHAETPSLEQLEAKILQCDKVTPYDPLVFPECVMDGFVDLANALEQLLDDDCRWKIWSSNTDISCGEKAQADGGGSFYGRRRVYCMTVQYLHLYAELLNRKLRGNKPVNPKIIELLTDPENFRIPLLEDLRKKLLDPNPSKEVTCEQRPMV